MITNFKIYEDNKFEYYWIIPIQKYKMAASLRKIGMPTKLIKKWAENTSKGFNATDLYNGKIYLFNNSTDGWVWETLSYDLFYDYSEFKGEIIPTKNEIEEEKIREEGEKYNL